MELANRHVVITGAARGIGRAFSKVCAEDKANVHLVIRTEDAALVKEMEEAGARSVTTWIADLSDREQVSQLIGKLNDAVPVDVLFNNAGVLTGGLLEEQNIDQIYKMLQVNISSLIHLTHGLLPGMLARKRGKIINNSSVSAYMHFPCASTYAASKAAVVAFTDCIRAELNNTGVSTLLLVTPGVKTRMFDEISHLYSRNIQVPGQTISPQQYARMIREAVLHDLDVMEPSGLTGVGLKIARYARPLFELGVSRRFRR